MRSAVSGVVERAAYLAASTSVIGIAPVVPVTYAEPLHVSGQLTSLDSISIGRAGRVVGEETRPEAARVAGQGRTEAVTAPVRRG
ncbi:hypothetical protein [Streptomyces tauricus]|uniref:hypothetical protein n=1 Tax=Streptomyces tauricus TaxID=68274 RepID=UPI002AD21D2E|nr:hypothetical protein [Streptomyces tauricus]